MEQSLWLQNSIWYSSSNILSLVHGFFVARWSCANISNFHGNVGNIYWPPRIIERHKSQHEILWLGLKLWHSWWAFYFWCQAVKCVSVYINQCSLKHTCLYFQPNCRIRLIDLYIYWLTCISQLTHSGLNRVVATLQSTFTNDSLVGEAKIGLGGCLYPWKNKPQPWTNSELICWCSDASSGLHGLIIRTTLSIVWHIYFGHDNDCAEWLLSCVMLNALRPTQNDCNFADVTFKRMFSNENLRI